MQVFANPEDAAFDRKGGESKVKIKTDDQEVERVRR